MARRTAAVPWILGLMLSACGGEPGGTEFDGDYAVTERLRASDCESPLTPAPVEETERYFRLQAQPTEDGGTRIAYYACAAPGECNDVLDLFRSFGRSDGAWVTTIATAVAPGCLLRFRRRELLATDDGVLIVDRVYEERDESVDDAECVQALARERGDSMPCVEVTETAAQQVP